MVKKSSLLERLKSRWKTGSGMRVAKSAAEDRVSGAVEAKRDNGDKRRSGLPATPAAEKKSSRKLNAREEAMMAMGEGFQELSGLVRSVQARVDEQDSRAEEVAEGVKALPTLGRAQLDLLRRMSEHFERQGEVGEQLLETMGGVQRALERAAATDERAVETLDDFRKTMDRIEGSMGKMVDSSKSQADATASLAREHRAEQSRLVDTIREGREEDVQRLVETHEKGVARLETATTERLDTLRSMQDRHAQDLTELVTANRKSTQLVVVLLSMTFFALAGILAVLAF